MPYATVLDLMKAADRFAVMKETMPELQDEAQVMVHLLIDHDACDDNREMKQLGLWALDQALGEAKHLRWIFMRWDDFQQFYRQAAGLEHNPVKYDQRTLMGSWHMADIVIDNDLPENVFVTVMRFGGGCYVTKYTRVTPF